MPNGQQQRAVWPFGLISVLRGCAEHLVRTRTDLFRHREKLLEVEAVELDRIQTEHAATASAIDSRLLGHAASV